MSVKRVSQSFGFVGLLLSLGSLGATEVGAQEVLKVYGPIGPAPAIEQAALVFGNRHDVEVEVIAGPPDKWLEQARTAADLLFTSDEFMMAELIRTGQVLIDESSVEPLYMRPSVILVRPGNPKGIQDFPDILKPGVRVMMVNRSGAAGMWREMVSKVASIDALRGLRRNVALYPSTDAEAMNAWREREDIDAWITWNIWHMPLRHRAELVPVSSDYLIYRQCAVAVTEKGRGNPHAVRFARFLTSPRAAEVFESWSWAKPLPGSSLLNLHNHVGIACRIQDDDWDSNVGVGLTRIRELIQDQQSVGIPRSEVQVNAVFEGDSAYWMLKDAPYRAYTENREANPNKQIIRELVEAGVSIELSADAMQQHGWKKEDLLPGVGIVEGAESRMMELADQGYGSIR